MSSIYRWLDTAGNGTGTKNAIGDYSDGTGSGVEEFYISPGEGKILEVYRMIVSIEDTGGMQAQEYGNTGGPLTEGITVFAMSDGWVEELDLCDGVPIKANAGWGATCFDVSLKTWGAGDDLLIARWTFEKSGAPLVIRNTGPSIGATALGTAAKMGVRLNDDFTGLVGHYFMVQGVLR